MVDAVAGAVAVGAFVVTAGAFSAPGAESSALVFWALDTAHGKAYSALMINRLNRERFIAI